MYVLFLLQHSQTAKPQALVSSLGLERPSSPVPFLFRCDRGLSPPVTWDPCPPVYPPSMHGPNHHHRRGRCNLPRTVLYPYLTLLSLSLHPAVN